MDRCGKARVVRATPRGVKVRQGPGFPNNLLGAAAGWWISGQDGGRRSVLSRAIGSFRRDCTLGVSGRKALQPLRIRRLSLEQRRGVACRSGRRRLIPGWRVVGCGCTSPRPTGQRPDRPARAEDARRRCNARAQTNDQLARMPHHVPRHADQPEAHRLHPPGRPFLARCPPLHRDVQVVHRNHQGPACGVRTEQTGRRLPAGKVALHHRHVLGLDRRDGRPRSCRSARAATGSPGPCGRSPWRTACGCP